MLSNDFARGGRKFCGTRKVFYIRDAQMCKGLGRHTVTHSAPVTFILFPLYKSAHKECAKRGRGVHPAHPIYFTARRARTSSVGTSGLIGNDGKCLDARFPQVS